MQEIVFGTGNAHKISEIKDILPKKYSLKSKAEIGLEGELPEHSDTIQGNALEKLEFLMLHTDSPCFTEDSGLICNSLNGAPGVLSARYAGEQKSDEDNYRLLLENLLDKEDRSAYFLTVIAYHNKAKIRFFEGRIEGRIAESPRGESGFGYDPVFIPYSYNQTFAELETGIKTRISHRARAVEKFIAYLDSEV